MKTISPLDDAAKAELYERMRRPDIWDRCHRFGWVITLVGTIVFQIVFWTYSVATFKRSVEDMEKNFGERIGRLERQIDSLVISKK